MGDTAPAKPEVGVPDPLHEVLGSLAHVQDAVFIKDRDGRYLMANAQASLLMGRSPEELVGRTDPEVFGAAGQDHLRADLDLMERGAAEVVEEEPVVVDGEPRTFLKTKAPLRDGSGEVIGLVAVSTDISDRKRLEEGLRRREAQLAEAQAIAKVGSWEWDVVADEVTWSAEFYEMLGMDPALVTPTYEGFIELIHPDDRAAAEGALQRALEGGEAYAVAHRLIRADGGERMMICRGRVDRDLDGTPLRMVGASLDLTEYMGVATELRVSHDQLMAAEEVAGSGSFEWDPATDEVRWSAGMYRIFGLRRDEFDGTFHGYLRLVHPDDRASRFGNIERLLAEGDAFTAEHRIRRGDGRVRWLSSRISVERDTNGDARRVIGVCRDVTDERG